MKQGSRHAPTFLRGADGKVYGSLVHRTLQKRVQGSKHLLRQPPAIAIDARLYDAYRTRFDAIEVVDTETGRVYRLPAERFDALRFELERGYGRQYAVPLHSWQTDTPEPSEQLGLGL